MKKYIKLFSIAIMLIGILMFTNAIGQPANYITKWNGTTLVNTVTPIFEDATNLRIGIGTTSPGYKLDVSGDLNIASTNAYRIGGNQILWHNGHTLDIFVGYHAGNSTMTGHANTLVGDSAGTSNSTGVGLTFMGYNAGKSDTASNNTAIGYQALYSDTIVTYNTAVGYQSL